MSTLSNAKDLGMSPKSYARCVYQQQRIDTLKEAASFDASETDSDVDQVFVTKVSQSKRGLAKGDSDGESDGNKVIEAKVKQPKCLAKGDSDDRTDSNDDDSSSKEQPSHRKAPCKQRTVPVPSNITFDSALFDSLPERPMTAPSKVKRSYSNEKAKKSLSSTKQVTHHKTSKKPKKKEMMAQKIRSDSEDEVAETLLSMNGRTQDDSDKEVRTTKPKKGRPKKALPDDDADAKVAGSGKRYSNIERLLVCKAWVRTSEDLVIGANMTSCDFHKKLHGNYVKLLTKQYTKEVTLTAMKNGSCKDGRNKPRQPTLDEVSSVFALRKPVKVGRYFSKTISYWVNKFQGLWETLPEESGTTFEDRYRITNQIFGRKYKNRNFNDLKNCWLYLQDIPKMSTQ